MTKSSIVTKSAGILDLICGTRSHLTFSQIVEMTGLPKSSVHRLLAILRAENLIAFDENSQAYHPGTRLITWASGALSTHDLPGMATPAMEDLCRRTRSHIALSILDGVDVLFLKTVEHGAPFRLAPRVGERSPVHTTAAGKVLLAYSSRSRRNAVLDSLGFERFTDRTIVGRGSFEEELERTRESGIGICDREEFLQIVGLAAPVFDRDGKIVAALSMWNSLDQQDLNKLLANRSQLLLAAREISRRLGHSLDKVSETG